MPPGNSHLDVHGCPFLEACLINGPILRKTAEPRSASDRTHSHRLFYGETLAITSCVLCRAFPGTAGWTCEGRILSFPGVSPSCSAARARTERGLLSQHIVGAQTETPRQEVWGFVFPQMSLSPSVRTRVGSGEAGSLSVDWCSWENMRRGIHGSTWEHRDGLCVVVPVSHEYLRATASDLGIVGECANCRSLSEHWCQDGKCATRTKARVAWNVVLYCSNRASICSLALILLSPSRVFVMTGWRTSISVQPFVQTRLDYGSLLYTSISFHPVFQNPCVSNLFELWILVCVHSSVSSFTRFQSCVQARLDYGCLSVYTHLSTALFFKHV